MTRAYKGIAIAAMASALAVGLLTPMLASANARNTVGTGRAAALVARPLTADLKWIAGGTTPVSVGAAALTVDPSTGEVCFDLRITGGGVATTSAHVHRGAGSDASSVVADLIPPNRTSSGCTIVSTAVANELATGPNNFSVDVHSPDLPAGIATGPLSASTTTSGAVHLLDEPLRAFDSRLFVHPIAPPADPRIPIRPRETWIVSLASGTDASGASRVAVPPGAVGALLHITIDQPTGPGFLVAYSASLATPPRTATVNWYEANAIAGADATVAVDDLARIKITAGPSATQVIVDVVGFLY